MSRRKSTFEDFTAKARAKHGDRYVYSSTGYQNARSCVEITCKLHGMFLQKASNHLSGNGCPVCGEAVARDAGATTRKTASRLSDRSAVGQPFGALGGLYKLPFWN